MDRLEKRLDDRFACPAGDDVRPITIHARWQVTAAI
jgi:hypothetical protein